MLQRSAAADKILLLGVDGLDPRLTKKYVDMGLMPNVKKYIEKGACREDLTMLGGHPTVTPPMWTTLATGCYANVHGVTGFFRCGSDIDLVEYNLDSRKCAAEPLWNVFAEAGKKTLVWHWPGSAWPPTSDSPNLYVVDGSAPGSVNMSLGQIESEFLLGASEEIKEVKRIPKAPMEASAACVITDLDESLVEEKPSLLEAVGETGFSGIANYIDCAERMTSATTEEYVDLIQSPIKLASGWADAPADAKEFTMLFSNGLIRRPALILKNSETGIYDKVAIYKSKKETEPIAVCPVGKMIPEVIDESIKNEKKYRVNRNIKLLKLDPEGKSLTMYISAAMDMDSDLLWHPKRLHEAVTQNVGYPTPTSMLGRQDTMLIKDCMIDNWYITADWQAAAMQYLIENEDLDVVFSHYHAVDLEAHRFVKHMADRAFNRNPVSVAEDWMQAVYVQTDYYLGKFLHYLDEGWTILIFSDHALVASKYDLPVGLIECGGVCINYMEEMGYTVPLRDENGRTNGIDWTKTKAVMQREGHLYLNLKGRNQHNVDGQLIDGIVDPADRYELEEEIMTKLYELKSPETGHRLISVALRNRDAVLLGLGGPESGDICCWMSEGYNFDHDDCLSTTYGESDTSVSPIFIAAGKGIKEGYYTERYIREVDFAPTVAVLGGVRMPAQCEGAPVYQILSNEY